LLFSYLEAVFVGLFGFSDEVARLPSLLISVLTLPLLYVVARNMLNRRVALFSVALLALAPEAVVWGGRARMYALLQLLALLALYFFFRSVLDAHTGRDARPRPAWPWVVCFLAAIFAQDEAILLLPILWLAALVVRGIRWFLRPSVLVVQVLVPLAGVGARFVLNEIRVPGEVYTLVHDAFFRFPPALAHGIVKVAPFFTAPWAWPIALLFVSALILLTLDYRASRLTPRSSGLVAPAFHAYIVLAVAAAIVLVVNNPWQDDRYLFMVLPSFFMVASWGLDRLLTLLARRWPLLQREWVTAALVAGLACVMLPAGLSALARTEPDYSAAYRWLASHLEEGDLVAAVRPAPAAVYLGRSDLLLAEDKHQEFIMRLDGEWIDRWAGAQVLESPEAFRETALQSGQRIWFVIDEDRFGSVRYSPEFVALILEQMDLVWHEGSVLVFRGQGYDPPPHMDVTRTLDASFGDQVLLKGYGLSTDRPEPGQKITLDLYWQAVRPERNYTVFAHVVGLDNQGLTQVDGQPLLGLYDMTTHWPRDRVVTDTRKLALPADTAPGRYRLEVGLYDADDPNADPLSVQDAAGNLLGQSLTVDYLHVDVPPVREPSQPVEEGELGGAIRLVGYDLSKPTGLTAGASQLLTLTWESLAPVDKDYTVFIHLADSEGRPVAQVDGQPLGGAYPTSFWDGGERLADPYVISIPSDVPAGEYELLTGMYLLATRERLPASGGGDVIHLTTVKLEAP
jgi:hypothetical protein